MTGIEWIDCELQMPDADMAVLIYAPRAEDPVWLGFFDGLNWRDVEAMTADGVTHWAELPAPPTVGARE